MQKTKRTLRTTIHYFNEAIVLFFAQLVLCCVISINYRAIAQANYFFTGISAAGIAVISFFLIKRISKKSKNPTSAWIGFMLGSVCGDFAGIFLSKIMLGA